MFIESFSDVHAGFAFRRINKKKKSSQLIYLKVKTTNQSDSINFFSSADEGLIIKATFDTPKAAEQKYTQ